MIREIKIYSNYQDDVLDYRKTYYFHHWVNKTSALVENEEGKLIIVKYDKFYFNQTNNK